MTPTFYDTHAHLDYPDFANDFDAVLARAEAAGISKIITIGTDIASSRRAIELAEKHARIFAAVGWHPAHVSEAPEPIAAQLRELALHPKVVAIGETGLDFYRLPSKTAGGSAEDDERYRQKQRRIFREQLELAAELGLNCVIHQRESFDDILSELKPFAGSLRAVFHCFVGGADELQRVLDLNALVSFTGIVTFKNAQTVRESLAAAPPDRYMLETDCPFLAPAPNRGKRCEPAYVRHTAEAAAQARGITLEELSRQTCQTADFFFSRRAIG